MPKRTFTPVSIDGQTQKYTGTFRGSTPKQAALKIYTRHSTQKPHASIVTVRETTDNSCQKAYTYRICETDKTTHLHGRIFPVKTASSWVHQPSHSPEDRQCQVSCQTLDHTAAHTVPDHVRAPVSAGTDEGICAHPDALACSGETPRQTATCP
ncbi:hypothetical protein CL622_03745 [archaeon]|nr:hypothetical protein [archaeon]